MYNNPSQDRHYKKKEKKLLVSLTSDFCVDVHVQRTVIYRPRVLCLGDDDRR